MDNARVVIFEDDQNEVRRIRGALANSSHTITAEAGTAADALEVVENIGEADDQIPCDVVILDGNLDPGSTDGRDVSSIHYAIRRRKLGVKIIGFSMNEMTHYGIWHVDADPGKFAADAMDQVIDQL